MNAEVRDAIQEVLAQKRWPSARSMFLVVRSYKKNVSKDHDEVYRALRALEHIATFQEHMPTYSLRKRQDTASPMADHYERAALEEIRRFIIGMYDRGLDIRSRPIAAPDTVVETLKKILDAEEKNAVGPVQHSERASRRDGVVQDPHPDETCQQAGEKQQGV